MANTQQNQGNRNQQDSSQQNRENGARKMRGSDDQDKKSKLGSGNDRLDQMRDNKNQNATH